MKKVYLAILNQGVMNVGLAKSLLSMASDPRVKLYLDFPSDKPITHNRNKIVKSFLESDADYLMMIDDDVTPLNNPLDLIELDKDVMGLPALIVNNYGLSWAIFDKLKDGYNTVAKDRQEGLQKVDAVGTGCILIKREVLKRIKAPFSREWDEDGLAILGTDLAFCERVYRAGFEVWSHFGYPCEHNPEGVGLLNVVKLIK